MNPYQDARILQTKKKIMTAFLNLLAKESFDSIRITSICKEASVSRTSFYQHFQSKVDVVQACKEEISQEILGIKNPQMNIEDFLRHLVHIWDKHYFSLRLLFSPEYQSQADFQTHERLEKQIKETILPLLQLLPSSQEDTDYYATFYAGATYALLRKWLTDSPKLPAETFLEKIFALLPNDFRQQDKIQIYFK